MPGHQLKALDSVTLAVPSGEFIAITGPSGSGKSTLMNIIGCLDVPTSGYYRLNGFEVGRLTDNQLADIRNRQIGFVFQSFNLLPRLSALDNVAWPLVYRGVARKEQIWLAMAALEKVGLADRVRHRPLELSGGQQQRVAIARALVGDPAVILADEPTGNLDTKSGREVVNLLEELHQLGKTIVLITHDTSLAARSQWYVEMLDGRIVNRESGGNH
jgi:putative ABC transport system ATP-binding protein